MSYIEVGGCCDGCSSGGRCPTGQLPSVPEASLTNWLLLGLGVAFAYLVFKPKKKRS